MCLWKYNYSKIIFALFLFFYCRHGFHGNNWTPLVAATYGLKTSDLNFGKVAFDFGVQNTTLRLSNVQRNIRMVQSNVFLFLASLVRKWRVKCSSLQVIRDQQRLKPFLYSWKTKTAPRLSLLGPPLSTPPYSLFSSVSFCTKVWVKVAYFCFYLFIFGPWT